MNFKKIIALLISFLLCLSLFACKGNSVEISSNSSETHSNNSNTISDNVPDNNNNQEGSPLLYKVTGDNGNVIWLFGSIHAGRESFYPLPDYVLDAFNSSDILAVEADIVAYENDYTQQTNDMQIFLYKDGTTIKDHIPDDLYNEAVDLLTKFDSYLPAMDYFNASLWNSMLTSLLYDEMNANFDLGIDRHLIESANTNDKEIQEIESIEFQYQMEADYSDELQILLLKESIKSFEDIEKAKNELEDMMDIWASGDEKKFAEFLTEDTSKLTEEELPLYNEYNNAMITNRNISMTNYAENALKSGKETFICVGAAHVVGDDAIADLMRERGYTVELIS